MYYTAYARYDSRTQRLGYRTKLYYRCFMSIGQSIVFEVNPRTTEDLKAAVEEAIGSIPSEMLQRTVANFTQRLELCCAAKGGHFETK